MEHIAQKPKEYTAFEFRPGPSPGPSWAKPWQPASQSFGATASPTTRLPGPRFGVSWAKPWQPGIQNFKKFICLHTLPSALWPVELLSCKNMSCQNQETIRPSNPVRFYSNLYIYLSLSLSKEICPWNTSCTSPKNIWLSNFVLANKN